MLADRMDAKLASWSSTCKRFFREGDVEARRTLEYFDRSCFPGAADAAEKPPVVVFQLLSAAGLADEHGSAVQLNVEAHASYVAARNAARTAVHLEGAQVRRDRLQSLLERFGNAPPVAAGCAGDLPTMPTAEVMRGHFRTFLSTYRSTLGAHPFIKGLAELLKQQLASPTVWRWLLQEEMFMESSGDAFMADAIELLMCFFCFVPRGQLGEEGVGATYLAWEVAPELSDPHIRRLLTLLPADFDLEGRATGELMATKTQRLNMSGALDEPDSLMTVLLDKCVIL
eukprot:TRINITY_DN34000_c0_g1_i1.p1 TRINITY_DN34000_c0_g1~~TRINITY_DN34000_c0_g1_i1.p1  ORF type:complete len:285 (+),score=64.34 TRINITY_DN34000_c0_g1_i1:23-877(+)